MGHRINHADQRPATTVQHARVVAGAARRWLGVSDNASSYENSIAR